MAKISRDVIERVSHLIGEVNPYWDVMSAIETATVKVKVSGDYIRWVDREILIPVFSASFIVDETALAIRTMHLSGITFVISDVTWSKRDAYAIYAKHEDCLPQFRLVPGLNMYFGQSQIITHSIALANAYLKYAQAANIRSDYEFWSTKPATI